MSDGTPLLAPACDVCPVEEREMVIFSVKVLPSSSRYTTTSGMEDAPCAVHVTSKLEKSSGSNPPTT
jgi:hypothetical protein